MLQRQAAAACPIRHRAAPRRGHTRALRTFHCRFFSRSMISTWLAPRVRRHTCARKPARRDCAPSRGPRPPAACCTSQATAPRQRCASRQPHSCRAHVLRWRRAQRAARPPRHPATTLRAHRDAGLGRLQALVVVVIRGGYGGEAARTRSNRTRGELAARPRCGPRARREQGQPARAPHCSTTEERAVRSDGRTGPRRARTKERNRGLFDARRNLGSSRRACSSAPARLLAPACLRITQSRGAQRRAQKRLGLRCAAALPDRLRYCVAPCGRSGATRCSCCWSSASSTFTRRSSSSSAASSLRSCASSACGAHCQSEPRREGAWRAQRGDAGGPEAPRSRASRARTSSRRASIGAPGAAGPCPPAPPPPAARRTP
jgi:hypothetical protein